MIITIEAQIACVRREIGMRRRVYPRWIDAGRMSQEKADLEFAAMEAVLATLEECLASRPVEYTDPARPYAHEALIAEMNASSQEPPRP